MATKIAVEPLAQQQFYRAAEAQEAAKTHPPAREEIQVLARRLQNETAVCIALMSLDCEAEVHEIAVQIGQEWARRSELKVCIASLPGPPPNDVQGRVQMLPAVPGRVVEFSYGRGSASEMQQATGDLGRQFDNVIAVLPSPFINPDGLAIVRECEKIVLVVKAGVTRRSAIKRVISEIESAGSSVSGVVLYGRRYPIPKWLYNRI